MLKSKNNDKRENITEETSCGIDYDCFNDKINSHFPDFDENNICKCCGYQFDMNDIENDKQKFDKVFFCS